MAQRHAVAEARLLKKWICMKCSATHRGSKPGSCRKCGYKNFRPKVMLREGRPDLTYFFCSLTLGSRELFVFGGKVDHSEWAGLRH